MLIDQHVQTAREFLLAADRELADGDVLQGSEKLWGAAAHAVMAVAQERGWPFGDHRSLNMAAQRLTEETGDPAFEDGFSVAEKLHANFYHRFMDDLQLQAGRRGVQRFVDRALALLS